MSKIKIILSYIFGFILAVSLFILSSLFIVKKTVLDKSFMYRVMDENNYYTNVYNAIIENIEDYMVSSGLESEVLDGVISKNKVEKDIKEYTNGLYSGTKYEVNTTEIKDKLKSNINNYLKKLNLGIDNTNELDLFIGDVEDIYRKEVSFYNTIDKLSSIINRANNIVDKIVIVLSIVSVILLVIILLFRSINVGSCIMSSGIIMFLMKLFIYERIDTNHLLIVSDNFSLLIRTMFKYISKYMIYFCIILVCIGFILSLFNIKQKTIEKKTTN